LALQDNFAGSMPETDYELALNWHSYAQGVADVLYPNQSDRLALAMRDLFSVCLLHPDLPISKVAQSLSAK